MKRTIFPLAVSIALVCVCLVGACGRTGLVDGGTAGSGVASDAGYDVPVIDVRSQDGSVDVDPPDVQPDVPEDVVPDVRPGVCGDGEVNGGEECDDGDFNSDEEPNACRTDCRLAFCGDGVTDDAEECDDGNLEDYDLCSTECRRPAIPCTECDDDSDCGRGIDQCIGLLDGEFCSRGCRSDDDCPQLLTCDASIGQCVPPEQVCSPCFDPDGDGFGIGLECAGFDCDETRADINPAALEICDDLDNDCDFENDEVCPPDLIVLRGEEVELSGSFLFDNVTVRNGGTITITPFDGEPGDPASGDGTGALEIDARIVRVENGGRVDGTGAGGGGRGQGETGGAGMGLRNVGPGGGGYGGFGGAGPGAQGGRPFGTREDEDISMGSNGGSFVINEDVAIGPACDALRGQTTIGGIGGGVVVFSAPDIRISGEIVMDGAPGEDASTGTVEAPVDGAGGGSGGGILLLGERVTLDSTAVLSVRGGEGGVGGEYRLDGAGENCVGHGGGGGSGGRIKVFGVRSVDGSALIGGGDGGTGPQSNATAGERGTFYTE